MQAAPRRGAKRATRFRDQWRVHCATVFAPRRAIAGRRPVASRRREVQERWTAAGELPWIRGMRMDARKDSRRLLWLTVALMFAGLLAALWIQGRAPQVARRSLAHPSGAVRAVPR